MNKEIAIIYSKRCVAQAAFLFWKTRWLAHLVYLSIVSLFLVFSIAFQKEKIRSMELFVFFILLGMPWGSLISNYFQFQRQMRPVLGRTVKYVLYADRISRSSDHGMKDVLWWDLDRYAKSSKVTLLYSSRKKAVMFFPNAMLSGKAQAYMWEKFNEAVTARLNERLNPPVIASASDIKRKYLAAFLIILVLAAAMAAMLLGLWTH